MAAPTPAAFNTTDIVAPVTSHVLDLPTGASAGDRILFTVGFNVPPGTITPPTGMTVEQFISQPAGGTADLYTFVYEKQASETTCTLTTANSAKSATCSVRVTGDSAGTLPEITAGAIGANGPPDPDSLAPTGGSKDYLFIACGTMGGEIAMTAAPTNYVNFQEADSGTAGSVGANCRTGLGTRQLTAASDDPGAFTGGDATQEWAAMTVAFHPPSTGPQNVDPAALNLTLSPVAPKVNWQRVTPALVALTLAVPAPTLNQAGGPPSPAALNLTLAQPAPQINIRTRPAALTLTLGLVEPDIVELRQVTPGAIGLNLIPQPPVVAVISFQPAAFQTDAFETIGAQVQTVVPTALSLSLNAVIPSIATKPSSISLRLILPTSGAWDENWGTGWGTLIDGMHVDVVGVAPSLGLTLGLPAPAVARVHVPSIVLELSPSLGWGQRWGTNWGGVPEHQVVFNPSTAPNPISLTLSPVAPAVNRSTAVAPAAISLSITPQAFELIGPQTLEPASLDLSLENPEPDEITVGPPAPSAFGLTLTAVAPVVAQVGATVSPALVGLTLTVVAPQVRERAEPGVISLTLGLLTPNVAQAQSVNPAALGLGLAPQVPLVQQSGATQSVLPAALGLTLTAQAPLVRIPQSVAPVAFSLTITNLGPVVLPAQLVAPAALSLSLTAQAPLVRIPQSVNPAAAGLILVPQVPVISSGGVLVIPPALSFTLTPVAPQARVTARPGVITLTLSPVAPDVRPAQSVTAPVIGLVLTPLTPTIAAGVIGTPVIGAYAEAAAGGAGSLAGVGASAADSGSGGSTA